MSNVTNTILLEEAYQLADYFEGKLPAKLIRRDVEAGDYASLATHVKQARDMQFDLEYAPNVS